VNVLVSLVNIYGVIDHNEWKTEKHHECTNMGKVKWLKLWWQLYLTSLPERDVQNIRLLNFCWTVCTKKCNLCDICTLCQSPMVFHSGEIRENAWCELDSVYVCIIFVYCVMCYMSYERTQKYFWKPVKPGL